MKKYTIYLHKKPPVTVESERVFVGPEGRLSFYNVSNRSDVAGFAPGMWVYYREAASK